jgi:hypothetical protein
MKLHAFPRPIPMSVYDETRQMLMEKNRRVPGVLALLEFGTIPLPGMSDIDFFIVVEPNRAIELPHFKSYTPLQQEAMCSLQCTITPETFEHLSYYDPWFLDVHTRYDSTGGRFQFVKEKFSTEEYAALSLRFVFEKLTFGCLPFIARTRSIHSLHVRHFFEEAKQIKYFLREFARVGVSVPTIPQLTLPDDLAKRWFQCSEDEQSTEVREAYKAFTDAMPLLYGSLQQHLQKIILEKPVSDLRSRTNLQREWLKRYPQSLIIHCADQIYVYQQGRKDISLERDTVTPPFPLQGPIELTTIVLPWELGGLASHHLLTEGCLSDAYRAGACTDIPTIPVYDAKSLFFLSELQNRNVWGTRNVRNFKSYEMRFGYRPRIDRHTSLRTYLSTTIFGWRRSLTQRFVLSRLRSRFTTTFQSLLFRAPLQGI